MGWNRGYEIYEKTIIAVYNSGTLTPELLKTLIEPYQDTDIDHGGCNELQTMDGLLADEVVVKLLAPEFYLANKGNFVLILEKWQELMGV